MVTTAAMATGAIMVTAATAELGVMAVGIAVTGLMAADTAAVTVDTAAATVRSTNLEESVGAPVSRARRPLIWVVEKPTARA